MRARAMGEWGAGSDGAVKWVNSRAGTPSPVEVAHRCEHVLEQRAGVRVRVGAFVAPEVDGQHLVPALASQGSKGAQLALSNAAHARVRRRRSRGRRSRGRRPPCPRPPSGTTPPATRTRSRTPRPWRRRPAARLRSSRERVRGRGEPQDDTGHFDDGGCGHGGRSPTLMDASRLMDCVFPRHRVDLSVPQRTIVRTSGNTHLNLPSNLESERRNPSS
jgi:hypothetical protein